MNNKLLLSEDNLDQFLKIDLNRTFNEFQKEKLDNDFDLEKQFQLERNKSRNFRIYGAISSTIIDCNNIEIKIYSDSDYNNLYTTIQSSSIAFNSDNIFRKKNGKYLIELNNYPHDVAYIKIETDNFYYFDQKWERRLVFYNADNEFVDYGTETVDINAQNGGSVVIENNFPFLYNKHWIRMDLDIVEEKEREISFSSTGNEVLEGSTLDMNINLNEPSPFGIGSCYLTLESPTMNYPYHFGNTEYVEFEGNDNESNKIFRSYNGKVYFFTTISPTIANVMNSGLSIKLKGGDYQGSYSIIDVIPSAVFDGKYKVIVDVNFNDSFQNSDPSQETVIEYEVGDVPDFTVYINGNQIEFPYNISWEVGEQEKSMQVVVNNDAQVEMMEEYFFMFYDKYRLKDGVIPVSKLTLIDNTPRLKTKFNIDSIYKNRAHFKGRKAYQTVFGDKQVFNYSSPSVLRNGSLWQGINQEFYPCENVDITIRNEGLDTVFPVNVSLGVQEEIYFPSGEEKTFSIEPQYESESAPMKVRTTYTGDTANTSEFASPPPAQGMFLVNGVEIPSGMEGFSSGVPNKYVGFKKRLDGGDDDYFNEFNLEKDFSVDFDDDNYSITFTSINVGCFLNIENTIEGWKTEVINEYPDVVAKPINFYLFSNTGNLKSAYDITIKKDGYRDLNIPSNEILETSEDGFDYYLINVLSDVLAPYDTENNVSFFLNRSIYKGGNFFGVGNMIPSFQDILFEKYEEEGPNGYIGSVMPLADVVYTKHVSLLSENNLPYSKENLTSYGKKNESGEIIEAPFWRSYPLSVIAATGEDIVSFPIKKAIEVTIPEANTEIVDGVRNFEFSINGNGALYKIGADSSTGLHLNATSWWEDGVSVRVCDPANGSTYNGLPSFKEMVETGDGEGNLGGMVEGELVEPHILRLRSSFFAQDFTINNINQFGTQDNEGLFETFISGISGFLGILGIDIEGDNGAINFTDYEPGFNFADSPFSNTDDSFFYSEEEIALAGLDIAEQEIEVLETYITTNTIVPNLLIGDENLGKNGLGGFAFQK